MVKMLKAQCVDFIFKHHLLLLCLLLGMIAAGGYFYAKLPVKTSVESLILRDDPDLNFYERFKKVFGDDQFVLLALCPQDDLFSNKVLERIARLSADLEKIREVREVVSLTNVEDIYGEEDGFYVTPLVGDDFPLTAAELNRIKDRAFRNKLIEKNIVSEDGQTCVFVLRTYPHTGDEDYQNRLLTRIESLLATQVYFPRDRFHLAGWVVTDVNMSRFMNRDMAVFMPVTYLLLALLVFLFLRSTLSTIIVLANISACLMVTMGWLYLVGGAMSPMTASLPPLMMALAVSDSIHLFSEFFKNIAQRAMDIQTALRTALQELAMPCFMTSLTTAVGFVSLYASNIPPIRHFGLAAAAGMMSEFLISVIFIPAAILIVDRLAQYRSLNWLLLRQKHFSGKGPHWGRDFSAAIVSFLSRAKYIVLAFSLVLLVGSAFGSSFLHIETNLIDYFKTSSRLHMDADFIDKELGGVNTLEISFRGKGRDYFLSPRHLQVIENIARRIALEPEVTKVISVNSFLKEMNRAFANNDPSAYILPASRALVAQYLLLYDGNELSNFLNEEMNWSRLSARINVHGSTRIKQLIARLAKIIQQEAGQGSMNVRITGKTFLVNKLVKNIVDSQVYSLATAFVIIFVILFAVFRSFALGLLSVVPNVLPIVFNFGLMGLAHIPLNTATAIISAVAIGIAVDDTIHYILSFQAHRRKGCSRREAAVLGIRDKAVPMFTTSLILVFGFGILVFSSFVPTIQFGLLSAVIMLSALVCDLLILPAILLLP